MDAADEIYVLVARGLSHEDYGHAGAAASLRTCALL